MKTKLENFISLHKITPRHGIWEGICDTHSDIYPTEANCTHLDTISITFISVYIHFKSFLSNFQVSCSAEQLIVIYLLVNCIGNFSIFGNWICRGHDDRVVSGHINSKCGENRRWVAGKKFRDAQNLWLCWKHFTITVWCSGFQLQLWIISNLKSLKNLTFHFPTESIKRTESHPTPGEKGCI